MLDHRAGLRERMDHPDFSPQEVIDTFRFIEPINRWFGGYRPLMSFLKRESQSWRPDRTYHILDAGCGSGDVPAALVRWGRRHGYHLRVNAIDNHPQTVELARQKCQDYPEITVSLRDMTDLNEDVADYVTASMFLHHFSDEEVPHVLDRLLAHCRCKVIINDLLRDPVAYLVTWLFSLLTPAVFRHDARLSVRKGFTVEELHKLLPAGSSPNYRLETHFFYRFLLILSKGESP